MKRFGFVLFACLLLSITITWGQFRTNSYQPAQSSKNDNSSPLKKFYFGGGGSLGFGTGYNYYSIFPIAGYRVTDNFSVGTGVTYQRQNYTYYSPATSLTQYGVTPFIRYNFSPLFFQTELDFISSPKYDNTTGFADLSRQVYNRFLVGLGYAAPMGRRGGNNSAAFNILVMYDLLYTSNEAGVFGSPVVLRLFVTF